MKISVRRTHITNAGVGAFRCPIACALNECPGISFASVGPATCSYLYRGRRIYRMLPKEARKFIDHYDEGLPVRGFTFSISKRP